MGYTNYNMRIAKRIAKKYKFDIASINNIPDIDIFVEPENNKIVTDGCKEVLYNYMTNKTFPYGEQGLLVSTIDNEPKVHIQFTGNYKRIHINKLYRDIVE